MRYKHDTLLPIGAFKRQGSVVGGRSMRLHGGDSFYAEQSPEDAFRSQYEYALQLAAKGYPKALEDLKASGQIQQFQAKEAETAAINQAATQIAESRQPFDLAQFAGSDYARAAELANLQLSRGDPQGYAQQFIDQAAQGLAQIQAENKKQADLEAKYGNVRFGTGFGQALGYEYGLKNAYGDIYQKYDAQGNLTEYLDKNGKWVNTSTIKPTGFEGFDESGKPITGYQHPEYGTLFNNSNKYAPMMSPFREDQGGFLGEGGWKNLAGLVAAGLTAGFAAPAIGAIQGATGLGAISAGALYGGATGAASGAISGGGQGALKGGLIGAAGGALSGALGGGGAEAMPVNAPPADFTGMSYGDLGSLGIGEFQPFVGGDMGLGSGMITQFNPDGSFGNIGAVAADTIPEFGDVPTYDFNAPSGQITSDFDPNARILTAQEAENLMRYNILPADMQTPAVYDWLQTPKNLLSGEYGGLIKGGLTLGALAAANALKPQQQTQTTDGGLTSAQLQALVDAMPSMIGQYSAQAQQAGTGQMGQGYTPAVRQAIAQLFPTFSLPTQGPFYGAGRFGEGYAPNAPIIKV